MSRNVEAKAPDEKETNIESHTLATKDYVAPSQESDPVKKVPAGLTTRVSQIEGLTRTVLFVVAATLVATLVGATAIIMDQLHFNYEVSQDNKKELATEIETLKEEVSNLKMELTTSKSALQTADANLKQALQPNQNN